MKYAPIPLLVFLLLANGAQAKMPDFPFTLYLVNHEVAQCVAVSGFHGQECTIAENWEIVHEKSDFPCNATIGECATLEAAENKIIAEFCPEGYVYVTSESIGLSCANPQGKPLTPLEQSTQKVLELLPFTFPLIFLVAIIYIFRRQRNK
jgi:hypothetical protein